MVTTGGRENVLFSALLTKQGLSSTIEASLAFQNLRTFSSAATAELAETLTSSQASLEVFSHGTDTTR